MTEGTGVDLPPKISAELGSGSIVSGILKYPGIVPSVLSTFQGESPRSAAASNTSASLVNVLRDAIFSFAVTAFALDAIELHRSTNCCPIFRVRVS